MKYPTYLVAAGLAVSVAFSAPRAQVSAPSLVTVQNLGLAVMNTSVEADVTVFSVSELNQGGADLNGDGDALDNVLYRHDGVTGTTTNLGVQIGWTWVRGEHRLAFHVDEQGHTDLNGDGDTADLVLHVMDLGTGAIANTGLADSGGALVGEGVVALVVNEASQGATDLNGDGDTLDGVLHLYDPSTTVVTNLSLATGWIGSPHSLSEGLLVFQVDEQAQGAQDLNGDGDVTDSVLHVRDIGKATTSNLGAAGWGYRIFPGHVVFTINETFQGGADLTGDGDALDDALHSLDRTTGGTTNLGLAASSWAMERVGSHLLFTVPEWAHGATDLNGDGDTADDVLHRLVPASGVVTNLSLAAGFLAEQLAVVDGRRAAFAVSESASGATDLNADGDALDNVVHVYDPVVGVPSNVLLASWGVGLRGHRLGIGVSESQQGATDLNGDGDTTDSVLFLRDLGTGVTVNLGLTASVWNWGSEALFAVDEFSAGQDLNGDGDQMDGVVHAHDMYTGAVQNLSLAGWLPDYDEELQPVIVWEASQGGTDLNGDGDALDGVLHLVRPNYGTGLWSDADTLSIAAGGTQQLLLDSGSPRAGDLYLLIGSVSGTKPGIPFGSLVVPLNWDHYLSRTLTSPNPPLTGSFGTLDGWGEGQVLFSLPPASSPPLVGMIAHHAYVAFHPITLAITTVSDPVPLAFLP